MKIKLYVNDTLQEECDEPGIVAMVRAGNMNMFNMLGNGVERLISPYVDKEFLLSNGVHCQIRISQAELFHEACEILKGFQGMKMVVFQYGQARLEIEC